MTAKLKSDSFGDDELESFLHQSPPQGRPSTSQLVATKMTPAKMPTGSRRHKKNLGIILLSGLISFFGLAFWITGRRKAQSETIIETPASSKFQKDTNALVETSTEKMISSAPSMTPTTQTESIELKTNSPSTAPSTAQQQETETNHSTPPSRSTADTAVFGSDAHLNQVELVVNTAMNAILEEYGQVPQNYYQENDRISAPPMFAWDRVNLTNATEAPEAFQKRGKRGNGGWTSDRSWKGLVLRLIQSMSQQSDFTVVLGGHSAAAGHGNHFRQSYLMQFHKVMAPVFRQFGVTLTSRNQAQGGLGTVQSSLGFSSIYGSEIDLMLWDSGKMMTTRHGAHCTSSYEPFLIHFCITKKHFRHDREPQPGSC